MKASVRVCGGSGERRARTTKKSDGSFSRSSWTHTQFMTRRLVYMVPLSALMTGCSQARGEFFLDTPALAWGAMFVGLVLVFGASGGDRKAASGFAVVAGALIFLWG